MRRKLPSLSALTAFNAAANHQSITRAADQLALTESAVSRQISQLEQQLGVRLFHRIKKRIVLTHAGTAYAARVVHLLKTLERDTFEVMGYEADGTVLEIGALPTVGTQWLIPRLPSFYADHPKVTVNVSARSVRFFFSETALDGALYFGKPDWPGTYADYLFDEILVPVGSPKLISGKKSLTAQNILSFRLLHLATRTDAWRLWCMAAGIEDVNVMRGPRFDIQSMLISAACSGIGIALLPRFLITDQLQTGQLQILSPLSVSGGGQYFFSYPQEKLNDPLLTEFRSWLQIQTKIFKENI